MLNEGPLEEMHPRLCADPCRLTGLKRRHELNEPLVDRIKPLAFGRASGTSAPAMLVPSGPSALFAWGSGRNGSATLPILVQRNALRVGYTRAHPLDPWRVTRRVAAHAQHTCRDGSALSAAQRPVWRGGARESAPGQNLQAAAAAYASSSAAQLFSTTSLTFRSYSRRFSW